MTGASMLAARYGGYTPEWMDERRRCAVLVPFLEGEDGLSLLFERRSGGIRQPGETCFPGGGAEKGESDTACALRETEEELGIPHAEIQVLGRSDFLLTPAGVRLQPVLGLLSSRALSLAKPAPAEVAEIFTVPLRFFSETEPELYAYTQEPIIQPDFPFDAVGVGRDYRFARGRVEVPVWHYESHCIWGITARIIRSVLRGMGPGTLPLRREVTHESREV